MIMLSRNTPVALVVGAAGFVGSHLTDYLLQKNIQLLAIDNFSSGKKENLMDASKDKNFHLVMQSAVTNYPEGLPRLDYAFFVLNSHMEQQYVHALRVFLDFCKDFKNVKVVVVSSIDVYAAEDGSTRTLQQGEKIVANFAKKHQLNVRVVRLASIFGPRMHFKMKDPLVKLIHASLVGDLQKQQVSTDFTTRSIYIEDAISLIGKAVFTGGTAHKIYDGVPNHPVKLNEIAQILLDPLWYEHRQFEPSELPPWPTPNLERTQNELHWHAKTGIVKALKETVHYFKDHPELVEMEADTQTLGKMAVPVGEQEHRGEASESRIIPELITEYHDRKVRFRYLREHKQLIVGLTLIALGIVYPAVSLLSGALSIRWHLKASEQSLVEGNFDKAQQEVVLARGGVNQLKGLVGSMQLLEKIPPVSQGYQNSVQLVDLVEQAVQGSEHAVKGTGALFQTAKIISGAENGDAKALLEVGQVELSAADRDFSQVKARIDDPWFHQAIPPMLQSRADDLKVKVDAFHEVISKGKSVAYLLPSLLAVDGKKSYLVLLQNNMELRPGGGFIGSYAQVDFDHGRLTNLKVNDIYSLDGALKDHVTPPAEIKNDLGQKDWFLRDSNTEPDFPTNARLAEWFYRKEAGVQVSGVVALDLSASQKLLEAVGPIELSDYQEKIDATNLFERAIAHAEVSFFSGSQAKKNFLSSLSTEMFNRIFFLPKQNWPGIIRAMGQSLDEKHMMVYLSDPTMFSYLTSQGWAGLMPRAAKSTTGERDEFLAVVEGNYGANKANYYVQRDSQLQTRIGKNGEVGHTLTVHYSNTSPTDIWPGGAYKARVKVYVSGGSKIVAAKWGGKDILKDLSIFSDYGRTGFSTLVVLNPKEQKDLVLEYNDSQNVVAADGKIQLRQDFIKQPGTLQDNLVYTINYALNFKPTSQAANDQQEIRFGSDLTRDRSFIVDFEKTK